MLNKEGVPLSRLATSFRSYRARLQLLKQEATDLGSIFGGASLPRSGVTDSKRPESRCGFTSATKNTCCEIALKFNFSFLGSWWGGELR